jgi:hypothetical protein
VGQGYLATDNFTWADFIQWTETSAGGVRGTIQEDSLGGPAGSESVGNTTDPVVGQITGTNVTVSIGLSSEMFGTLSHGVLRLDLPQQDGTIGLSIFTAASPDVFNEAVQFLRLREYNDNQSAMAREEFAAQELTIDSAASTVKQDLSTLSRDQVSIESAVASFANDLAQGKSLLATTASAEQKVVGDLRTPTAAPNQADVCSDAGSVGSDAARVSSAAVRVHSDGVGVEFSLAAPRRDVGRTQQDFQELVSAQQAEFSYQDGAPTAADVARVVGATDAAISGAVTTANGDISTANQYTALAFQDADAASRAGHCGGEATPPPPEPPIK